MRKFWIAVVVAIVLVVVAVTLLKPSSQTASKSALSTPQAKTFTLVVKGGKLVSGNDTLKVNQGDKVTITITNDEDEELHLHGYDKHVDLEKDQPGTLSFTADQAGRFEYELENSKNEIGALEVSPR